MEFEDYTAARDLFYLAVLFAGAGIGCVLNRFRAASTLRFRNRALTLALCLFSAMVAALAGALIYSKGLIVFEKPVYIPAAIALVLLILAVRFPRAAGFPLILVSGCLVIWIAYSFLQFSRLDTGEPFRVSVSSEGKGQYTARFASGRGNLEENLVIHLAGEEQSRDQVLDFCFTRLSYASHYPLIGGQNRGVVTEIRGEKAVFYADPRLTGSLLRGWYAWLQKSPLGGSESRRVLFEESREKIPVSDILPGTALWKEF
jgi:hypothetical protein